MLNLFLFGKIYLKTQLAPLSSVHSLIYKDQVNQCVFISSCTATALFFLLHSNEILPSSVTTLFSNILLITLVS